MKRVLIVTSSYRPTMIADMHRARHLAWELPRLGWEVEVLTPSVAFQRPEFVEPESAALFNPETPLHEVESDDRWWFRPLKIRGIGWRAFQPLKRAGLRLLQSRRFDLVYLTTANFNLFRLGSVWQRKAGVPYLLDFHDPWVRDRLDFRTTRHKVKLVVGAWLSRWHERKAVRGAAGIVAVSPVYLEELRARYGSLPCLGPDRCEAIPFAGSENDFRVAGLERRGAGATREIVYVGAGGAIMAKAFAAFCRALAEVKRSHPALVDRLRVRLHGTATDWKEGEPKLMEGIAAKFGLQDLVSESPRRVSYLQATRLALGADGLIVLGIDGTGYMPSKLFSYMLAGKPLLVSFRSDSPMAALFARLPALGHTLAFDAASGAPTRDNVEPMKRFVEEVLERRSFERRHLVADYLAPAMASRHAALFERVISRLATR